MNAVWADAGNGAARGPRARRAEVVAALSRAARAGAPPVYSEETVVPYECDGLTAYREAAAVALLGDRGAGGRGAAHLPPPRRAGGGARRRIGSAARCRTSRA